MNREQTRCTFIHYSPKARTRYNRNEGLCQLSSLQLCTNGQIMVAKSIVAGGIDVIWTGPIMKSLAAEPVPSANQKASFKTFLGLVLFVSKVQAKGHHFLKRRRCFCALLESLPSTLVLAHESVQLPYTALKPGTLRRCALGRSCFQSPRLILLGVRSVLTTARYA